MQSARKKVCCFFVKNPPGDLKSYIQKWFRKIPARLKNQLLVIDRKRLRGANFLDHITHLAEWLDRFSLEAGKVPNKTVEKSRLPVILEQVEVEGAIRIALCPNQQNLSLMQKQIICLLSRSVTLFIFPAIEHQQKILLSESSTTGASRITAPR